MPDPPIPDSEGHLHEVLLRRVARRGGSLEDAVHDILRPAASPENEHVRPTAGLGTRILAMFAEFWLEEGELRHCDP